ncbi:hypothetical protein IFT62_14175 [Pseudomonas lutea]|jgi:hypothetical protein|uniref:Uncharacterized protein n=1 Tax=Pseudomonas lutea TaxID=243924 RepID=A0ABR9A8B2_9PSED|nr:hypothetical protein [Pseudomonas lutea]MBD8122367.1 hypothetical protein [Pseudomonas lutea]
MAATEIKYGYKIEGLMRGTVEEDGEVNMYLNAGDQVFVRAALFKVVRKTFDREKNFFYAELTPDLEGLPDTDILVSFRSTPSMDDLLD